MKLAVRVLAALVVVAGFAAASYSSASAKPCVSHQSAAANMPIPMRCAPGIPCGAEPTGPMRPR